MASTAKTGVFPVYDNQFHVGATEDAKTTIADMESFQVAFNNGVETWTPMDQEGWQRTLMTAKAIDITINGKRNVGDTGNDFVAGLAFENGRDAEGYFDWTFPDGTVVSWTAAVYDVTDFGGGDSTNVGPLNFTIHSNGKPTVKLPTA
ncbi:MAG: phage tail tube protein [Lachnospiraceae bacterium]